MVKPSELQILLLAIAIVPLIVGSYRGIDLPGKRWAAAAMISLLGGYVATVVEGFFAETQLNVLEHVLYAISALCFATTALQLLRLRGLRERS